MANQGAGPVSGYQSHGPERRADAGHPHPATLGGSPMVRVPFTDRKAQASPAPVSIREELGRVRGVARTVSRVVQSSQRKPGSGGGGTRWTATVIHPTGGGGQGTPAYGGAVYNGGGGGLAQAMGASASAPKGLPAPPKPGPGVRVSNKPPTSMRRSQAGRSRRAENFKAKHSGPTVIQGTAEDVTPSPEARPRVEHAYFGRGYVYGPGGKGEFTDDGPAKPPRKSEEDIRRGVRNRRMSNSYRQSQYGMRL